MREHIFVLLLVLFVDSGTSVTLVRQPFASYTIQLDDWGDNSVRIRIANGPVKQFPGALGPTSPPQQTAMGPAVVVDKQHLTATKTNGNIEVTAQADGTIGVKQVDTGKSILAIYTEKVPPYTAEGGQGVLQVNGNFKYVFGFGEQINDQNTTNLLGRVYDLETCLEYGKSHGSRICIPFALGVVFDPQNPDVANYMYSGFFWNMPAYGSVNFNLGEYVEWTANNCEQLDFWVTAPPAKVTKALALQGIMKQYSDAVGRTPPLPYYAAGYWHSKNRYSTQKDFVGAATEFHKRGIPVDIMVIDYHHWKYFGDWSFDKEFWPDPQRMVNTLKGYDMEIMVSVWPFTAPHSRSYDTILAQKYCVVNSTNQPGVWPDPNPKPPAYLYDPTQPKAREYVFSLIKSGYLDYGIKIYWLDASEPEQIRGTPKGDKYSLGNMERMGMMFPYYHTQTMQEGLNANGITNVVMLARSAWAGSPKHGSAVWSGDTTSNWETLHTSVKIVQNTGISGMYWWTTDIGGYGGGQPSKDWFQPLIIRWFQFGFTCPIFRQHGHRNTEPWLLQNKTYPVIVDIIKMRYKFKPYVLNELNNTATDGTPFNRPLWFAFPDDEDSWHQYGQYMMGSKYLAAPVTEDKQTEKKVYLPPGTWRHYFTNETYVGKKNYTIATPLAQFPLFELISPEYSR